LPLLPVPLARRHRLTEEELRRGKVIPLQSDSAECHGFPEFNESTALKRRDADFHPFTPPPW
jgi:hypothetical protein